MESTTTHFELRGGERWRSPWDAYRALRDDHRVYEVADHDPAFWVLSRFNDVFEAARDTETFSSAQGLTPDAGAMEMFADNAAPIVMMDPPLHTAMRRLVSRPMTPRRVAPLDAALIEFVDSRLDIVEDQGSCDIVEVLLKPLPSFVVSHYLGVPTSDRSRFDAWSSAIVSANAAGEISDAADAAMDLFAYSNELIEKRRSDPGEDLVSDLVAEGDDVASAEWIVGFIFTMVTGGNDTVTGLLGGALELLDAHRSQRRWLIEDPARIRDSMDEFLRLTSPVQNLARTTTRPVEIGGETIPEGVKVMLVYGAANRDERVFGPDADALDLERQIDKILSFSYGPHHCLGAAVARLQGTIALERILDRFPEFSVDAAAGRFAPGAFVRRYESLPFQTS
jgi:cytochrome P450